MTGYSLDQLAREHVIKAGSASSRRSAVTLHGGHDHALRQTLVALTAGSVLAEHESPGEATVQVVLGKVLLSSGDDSFEGRPWDLLTIPPARHTLQALEDCAVLLTVAIT